GQLADEDLLALTSAVTGASPPGVVLLDTPRTGAPLGSFLTGYKPDRVVPVGSFPQGIADLERRLGVNVAPAIPWDRSVPAAFWKALFPRAEKAVVCPAAPRGLLLQAACLAGALQAPLYVTRDRPGETAALQDQLRRLNTRTVIAVGSAAGLCRKLSEVAVVRLASERAVAAAYLQRQLENGPVQNL